MSRYINSLRRGIKKSRNSAYLSKRSSSKIKCTLVHVRTILLFSAIKFALKEINIDNSKNLPVREMSQDHFNSLKKTKSIRLTGNRIF